MNYLKHFSFTLLFCLFITQLSAQRAPYRLLIYNKLHNSYEQVEDNKPYQIWVADTLNLKGYFDVVNENNFAFVTKDSTYILYPENVHHMARISGFSDRAIYTSSNRTGKVILGTSMVTVGSVFAVPFAIASLIEPIALIPTAFSAIIIGGGIAITRSTNNSKFRVSNSYFMLPNKDTLKLRIVKSAM